METGKIQCGDHICIAAEDPIHFIPLHYLILADNIAVETVSMSRVASFSDAYAIARSEISRPTYGTALFLPAENEAIEKKHNEFSRVFSVLSGGLDSCELVNDYIITRQQVLKRLIPDRIIHLDTHGEFDWDHNPYYFSGLLVSDGNGPPPRNDDLTFILTFILSPAEVVESGVTLARSHVTLHACVSGIGLPGKGGDILGMELALRLCGADSVLATHWMVKWVQASKFSCEFYRLWLDMNMSRAQAWRTAIQNFIRSESKPALLIK